MSSESANSIARNAVEYLYDTYASEFTKIEADAQNIASIGAQIHYDQSHDHSWIVTHDGGCYEETNELYTQMNDDFPKLANATDSLKADTKGLEKLMSAPEVADFKTALQAMYAVIGLNKAGNAENNGVGVLANSTLRNEALKSVEQILKNRLMSDACTEQMNQLSNVSTPGSASEIAQLAALNIQYNASIGEELNNLQNFIYNEQQSYAGQLDSAQNKTENLSKSQIWEEHFDLYEGWDYQPTIDRAKAALKSLVHIDNSLASLSPESGSAQLEQLQILVDTIVQSVKTIIDDKSLSTKGKVDALLPILMELLGIYKMIRQDSETQKAKNEACMEKAQTKAAEAQLQEAKSNATLQAEVSKDTIIGKIASDCSTVINVIVGAIMACAASGAASVIILTLTLLQATKVLGKLQNDIATAIVNDSSDKNHPENKQAAKIWAAVIMTAVEVGVTVLGGAAGDAAVTRELFMSVIAKVTSEEATETAITNAEETINTMVREACEQASTTTATVSETAAKDTIRKIAENAGKTAAKRMYAQLFKQNFIGSVLTVAKKAATKKLMEVTVKEAVMAAIEKSTVVATEAASGAAVSEETMEQIATQAANQAVADATKKSVEDISDEADRSSLAAAGRRAGASAAYGIASTNMLIDIATWAMKHNHTSENKGSQALLIILGIIQGIMQAVSMMAGGGFISQANITSKGASAMALIQKGSATLQTANQGSQSAVALAQASIDKITAKVQYQEQICTMLNSIIQDFLSNFIQNGSIERSAFFKEQAEETESQKLFVLNLQKGNEGAIQVLTEQTV